MSQHQAVAHSETDNAQAPLDFYTETLQDLDVRSDESANVKGGSISLQPNPVQNPSGGRMITSIRAPGGVMNPSGG